MTEPQKFTKKDFASSQEVRWCPGCGDYSILASVQKALADIGVPQEKNVFVSGIGCSSRFPYYMNTYGFHSIHGRAPAIATGVKAANPDLTVWVITGDGDGLSIGGNHLIHALRRNIDIKIILFNNRIYGLTKGQYSPTSELGKKTKSTPQGSIDQPLNPLSIALSAEATFVARSLDTNPKHMIDTFKRAAEHKGSAFIEVFQNCIVFNDGTHKSVTDKNVRDDNTLDLVDGQPLIFGKEKNKGIRLSACTPEVVTLGENGVTENDILKHNETADDPFYPFILSRMHLPNFPTPLGVFRSVKRPTYDELLDQQVEEATAKKGADLQALLNGPSAWTV